MIKKRGRPAKEEAKKCTYLLRLTEEEARDLESLAIQTGSTKAEIIRKGIRIVSNLNKYAN